MAGKPWEDPIEIRGLLVTQLEPDFKYALRVTSASVNGLGYPSEPYYFWAGVLPTERLFC